MFLFSSIISDLIQKDKAASSSSSNGANDSVQALKQLITARKNILREEIRRLEAEYRKEAAQLHAQPQHQEHSVRRSSIASIASSLSSSSSSTAHSVEEAKKLHTIQEIQARIEAEMTAIKASPEYRHCQDPSARQLVHGLKYWFIWVNPDDSA